MSCDAVVHGAFMHVRYNCLNTAHGLHRLHRSDLGASDWVCSRWVGSEQVRLLEEVELVGRPTGSKLTPFDSAWISILMRPRCVASRSAAGSLWIPLGRSKAMNIRFLTLILALTLLAPGETITLPPALKPADAGRPAAQPASAAEEPNPPDELLACPAWQAPPAASYQTFPNAGLYTFFDWRHLTTRTEPGRPAMATSPAPGPMSTETPNRKTSRCTGRQPT